MPCYRHLFANARHPMAMCSIKSFVSCNMGPRGEIRRHMHVACNLQTFQVLGKAWDLWTIVKADTQMIAKTYWVSEQLAVPAINSIPFDPLGSAGGRCDGAGADAGELAAVDCAMMCTAARGCAMRCTVQGRPMACQLGWIHRSQFAFAGHNLCSIQCK